MKRVQLPGTGIETSNLGIGCAPLMGGVGRRESLALLELAHSLGVTHIDTARSYGYGEAESMVGDFIAGRRDAVTVTTKLGITAPRHSRALSLAKSAARKTLARAPRIRAMMSRRAGEAITAGHFTVEEANASFETSLRELRTDYVDLLLLHEPRVADLDSEALLEFLESCVESGKTRQYGIASPVRDTLEILADKPAYAHVLQIPDDILERNVERLSTLRERPLFTHSAIREALPRTRTYLEERPELRASWSTTLGADCSDSTVLGALVLGYALRANPSGVVLFGSKNERHIRAAVERTMGESAFSGDIIEQFARLVEDAFAPTVAAVEGPV